MGQCPGSDDPKRFEVEVCNDLPCPSNLTCAAEQDVIVLIDGSEAADFEAQLALVRGLIDRSETPMRYGVVAYGNPAKVLSTVTDNLESLTDSLNGLQRPGGDPDLAQGAALARSLMQSSILDRPVVVLLLTDGRPTRVDTAVAAAASIRQSGARSFVGLVDDHTPGPRDVACNIASKPCPANVESVGSWGEMRTSADPFLVATCSNLLSEGALGAVSLHLG